MNKDEFLTRVINGLMRTYTIIYLVNLETEEFEWTTNDEKGLVMYSEKNGKDFFRKLVDNINNIVYPEDVPILMENYTKENVLKFLKTGIFPDVKYRIMTGDQLVWHTTKIITGMDKDDSSIIFGVLNIDNEVRAQAEKTQQEEINKIYQQVAEITAKYYDLLYYIDIDTEKYFIFYSSGEPVGGAKNYREESFAKEHERMVEKYVADDYKEMVLNCGSKEVILKELETKPNYSFIFKMKYQGQEQYCRQAYFLSSDKKHVVMGIENINHEMVLELDYNKEKKKNTIYSEIMDALVHRYDVIYYVDVNTDDYSVFSSTNLFGDITDEDRNIKKAFYEEMRKIVPKYAHIDDIKMIMDFLNKEYIIESLKTLNKVQLDCRLIRHKTNTYIRLTAFYSRHKGHILFCIENIDKETRALNKMKSMATKDALTGIRNKNAYKEFEMKMAEEIAQNPNTEFGLAVFDINNLKIINDNMGHQEGDEYIKSASKIICEYFKHSPVYRIGGDEFLVVLKDSDYSKRIEIINRIKEDIKDSKDSIKHPKMAVGMCEYDRITYNTVSAVFERADYLMYRNKKEMKESEND